jgi:hypothetical protein
VSVDPKAAPPALEPLTEAPFFSLRNVPLWACLALGAVVVGLIVMVPHS